MVEFFGRTVSSEVQNGQQLISFRIPAISRSLARRRAMVNARIKEVQSPEVSNIEIIEQGQIPGQNIFLVEISGTT